MKTLENELVIDPEPQLEATDEGDLLYFVNCPHCGEEHKIKIFNLCDEYETFYMDCDCLNHFIVEYLPGVPNERLLIY